MFLSFDTAVGCKTPSKKTSGMEKCEFRRHTVVFTQSELFIRPANSFVIDLCLSIRLNNSYLNQPIWANSITRDNYLRKLLKINQGESFCDRRLSAFGTPSIFPGGRFSVQALRVEHSRSGLVPRSAHEEEQQVKD